MFLSCYAQGQLQEIWSNSFIDVGITSNYYPIMEKTSADELIVVGANHVLKYDTLGNLLWSYEIEGVAYNQSSVGNRNDHLEFDSDGNIYALSNLTIYSNGIDTTMTVVKTIKIDPSGVEIWSSQYEYNTIFPQDLGSSIAYFDDAIYITGRSIDSLTYCDVFLVKYSALDGTEIWRTTFHDEDDDCDRGDIVLVDSSGNIYVGGKSSTPQNNEYLLLKYNSMGNLMWVSSYVNPDFIFNLFTDMVLTNEGNIVLSGFYYSTVCFSSNGQILWHFTPTSNLPINVTSDMTYDIISNQNSEIIITGKHRDSEGPPFENDILTIKLSSDGNLIWQNRYDTDHILQFDTGHTLFIDENDDVYVGGKSTIEQSSGSNDNFTLIKLSNESGDLIWDYVDYQNPNEDDVVRAIHVDINGALYASGTNIVDGEKQFLIKKYFEPTVSVSEFGMVEGDFHISPNPNSTGQFKIESSHLKGTQVSIKVIDITGKMIMKNEEFIVGNSILLPDNANGLYFIQIEANDYTYNKRVIVQR